ncbi:hypothetical protein D3C73_929880 [compost metagenome]
MSRLKHDHQFSSGTFLMQFQVFQQAQVGFDRLEQFGASKHHKAGDMQGFVHGQAPTQSGCRVDQLGGPGGP